MRDGGGIFGFQGGKAWAQQAGQKKADLQAVGGEVTAGAARFAIEEPFEAQSSRVVTHFRDTCPHCSHAISF